MCLSAERAGPLPQNARRIHVEAGIASQLVRYSGLCCRGHDLHIERNDHRADVSPSGVDVPAGAMARALYGFNDLPEGQRAMLAKLKVLDPKGPIYRKKPFSEANPLIFRDAQVEQVGGERVRSEFIRPAPDLRSFDNVPRNERHRILCASTTANEFARFLLILALCSAKELVLKCILSPFFHEAPSVRGARQSGHAVSL